MKGDPRVIEYLNKSLRHELTVVNQFWVHSRLLADWGFQKLADKELEEADEERQHSQDLIDRIIFLEGLPNLQTLDPLRIGQSLKECLECDLAAEYVARALYKEAREVCREIGDYVTMSLFERLLGDEEGHIDFLETQLELIEQIGIDNYSLLQAKSADQAE
ncbi:bacterioferritin [Roseibium porphyridii]|uniref:Bacterioferritin n=1 Tax=Roseibium porphyridii TaxID=2866279 RepID=A0ABY8F7N7_9HYPH|nr:MULTISPECIES: bacterioferritin [Stappiaceae]QFT34294.1 Bacterioferritin [Labrenzia sp. THAF82]WFE89300.1 bacterioferritin [Roseibium sp. KMA01]